MKRNHPKKPTLKKYPAKPKRPKGGIKTAKQLESWENRVKVYSEKCKEIDKENGKKMSEYNKKVSDIERIKSSVKREKDAFKKRLENVNKNLVRK